MEQTRENEKKIILECQKGDYESFSVLYDLYIKKIYDFVYYKTHHTETAEDLVSKIFFKALDKIDSFDTDQGYFSAWLYRIARNTIIDHYRAQKNDFNINDVWDLPSGHDVVQDLDVQEKLREVKKYIKELNEEQRNILIMRLWQGMSYKEIAKVLSKSEGSCKMVFSRAIKKLRQEIPMALLLSLFIN